MLPLPSHHFYQWGSQVLYGSSGTVVVGDQTMLFGRRLWLLCRDRGEYDKGQSGEEGMVKHGGEGGWMA